jgi:SAM-dependent methyltransferase
MDMSPNSEALQMYGRVSRVGDVWYERCPICEDSRIECVWRIPFSKLKTVSDTENVILNGYAVQYLPMYGETNRVYQYYACQKCESIFLNPQTSRTKTHYSDPSNVGARRKIDKARLERTEAVWKGYIRHYQKRMKPHLPSRTKVVLDAGCGGGQYLILAREDRELHAERLIGLELSPAAVDHLQELGIEAYQCDLLGVSYCGSTLVSLVLGSLPGVANVGESHWLLEPRLDKLRDTYNLAPDGFEQCVWCEADCPLITDDLRRHLADQPHGFYQILADAYKADIIVSADKNYPHVVRRDPGLHNDAVIIFRHPSENWRSHARRSSRTDNEARLKYLDNWAIAYTNFLDNFPNTGKKISVDLDLFLVKPKQGLQHLCFALDLPFAAEALAYWHVRQHCVGGNHGVRQSLADNDIRALEIGPRGASAACFRRSADQVLPSEVASVYRRLQLQSRL